MRHASEGWHLPRKARALRHETPAYAGVTGFTRHFPAA
jgi:hypothetical protein